MTITRISEHKNLFENLICIDVLLTNKCNLRCSYCFQQHTDDHEARFTQESMRQVWDWLRDLNPKRGKKIQFFGGEPMLHRDFILEFLRRNREEFEAQDGHITTTIVTNGLLFDEDFLREYLSYPGTEISFSIDTVDSAMDVRGLTQQQINTILNAVELACKHGSRSTIAARINITRENVAGFKNTFHELYKRGLRRFWFHPLVHSFEHGLQVWSDEEWNNWRKEIYEIIDADYDLERFTIVEGVGIKEQDGLSGVTDIAMDGSGDFTSCYVWINQKDEILGNVFRDEVNLPKYLQMKDDYDHMIETENQCISCDVKNLCFQFSSGNKAIDGRMYRPDAMCQRMVQLYTDVNDRLAQNRFRKKAVAMFHGYQTEGDVVLARSLVHLIKVYLDRGSLQNPHAKANAPDPTVVKELVNASTVNYRNLLGLFLRIIDGYQITPTLENIVYRAMGDGETATARDVYYKLVEKLGITVPQRDVEDGDVAYITMLHMLILSRLAYYHAVAWGGYE